MPVTLRVRDIMNKDVTKVYEDESVHEATKKMVEKGVKCAVVVNNKGEPVGVITEGTVTRKVLLACKDPREVKVKDIMSKPIITIKADATLKEASDAFLKHDVKQLYVEEDGKIVGLLTEHRILKAINEVIMTLLSI